jgi:hypothetical protein
MKWLFFCLLIVLPVSALAQVTNPAVIYQQDTIILQDSDVYYAPYAPPVPTDTREKLCCIAKELADLDGVTDYYSYDPKTNGHSITSLYGDTATWMRLFQAARKPDGTKTAIITQRSVTVSRNEDVDFRASGSIRLNSGFHVKPGAYFHAYIEPQFDSVIFSDEFDHSSLPKWSLYDSIHSDANAYLASKAASNVTESSAGDNKALTLTIAEDSSWGGKADFPMVASSTCRGSQPSCTVINVMTDTGCHMVDFTGRPFSAAQMASCPWPYKSADDSVLAPVSQSLPYGKYEIRDRLPMGLYHSNTYSDDNFDAWNLGETEFSDTCHILPGLAHRVRYGPYRGKFGKRITDSSTVLRSASANFSLHNFPNRIIIDNFPFAVGGLFYDFDTAAGRVDTSLGFDRMTALKGGLPSSFIADDSVTFYFERTGDNISDDSTAWTVDSTGHYFSCPSAHFTKEYQPYQLTLFPDLGLGHSTCHWDHNTDKIWMDTPLDPSYLHSRSKPFTYSCIEGCAYPQPKVHYSGDQWHTWTMELLPHECRFLLDGRVVQRVPDRLIPRSDKRADFVSNFPRMLTPFTVQFEIDGGNYTAEKDDFEHRYGTQMLRKIDYMKIWALPAEYHIPKFPN